MTYTGADHDQLIEEALDALDTSYTSLSTATRNLLRPLCSIHRYDKQEVIVQEGAYSSTLYYVIQGSARAWYLKDGKEITDWFSFEGDFITAINSYFMGVPSPHFVESIEPTIMMEMSREEVNKAREASHEMERLATVAITKTMLHLQQRVVALQFESASQKYENLLRMRPDIEQRVPLGHIASHLGITLETLSRIRASARI